MEPFIVVIIVLGIIGCFVCGFMSEDLHRRKGYEGGFWLGFLLGIAGLVYSAGLPDIRAKKVTRNEFGEMIVISEEDEAPAEEEQGTAADPANQPAKNECPNCFAKLSPDDQVCPNCGFKIK